MADMYLTRYVVISDEGKILEHCKSPYHDANCMLLLIGDNPTVFKTRRAAQYAINRTVEYANTHKLLRWDTNTIQQIKIPV